jgi:hypothetical protein
MSRSSAISFLAFLLIFGSRIAKPSPPDKATSDLHRPTVTAMREAAVDFLDSLGPDLAAKATFAITDEERKKWSNLPWTLFKREGVRFGEMSPEQRLLAHELIESPLSSQGYLKATGIMRLDQILRERLPESRAVEEPMFGQDFYWIGIFGDPRADRTWGWQLDGHHLALNFTVVGNDISVTPAFLGADPAEVRSGNDIGWYILGEEDRRGRALFDSLDDRQRARALLSTNAPRDVITGPGRADQLKEIQGLPVSQMSPGQQRLLMRLLGEYLHNLEDDTARAQLERVQAAGLEQIHFSWAGLETGKPYYYRLHGPKLLIEFDNSYPPGQDTGPINHIHTVWRDTERDYGEDLLRKHYAESPRHRDEGADESLQPEADTAPQ